jgi:mannan endo-1,4-beta-mannosidase
VRGVRALLAGALLLGMLAGCVKATSGIDGTGTAAPSPATSSATAGSATAATSGTASAAAAPWPGWPGYLPDPHHRILLGGFVELSGESVTAAVVQRQRAMGRPYDLQLTYYNWMDPFPDYGEAAMVARGSTPLMAWYAPNKEPGSGHSLAEITSGADDSWITQQADAIKAFNHLVYLRLMPEMNGTWYGYSSSPSAYIAAWRHIHDVFEQAGASNVSWVWCPNLEPSNWDPYYPGNSYVDVVGVDGFSNTRYTWQTFRGMFDGFFRHMAALTNHKPQMVVETGTNSGNGVPAARIGSAASFITGMASYLKSVAGPEYGVVAVCWFDTNVVDGKDWRTDQTPAAWRAWLAMARDPFFGGVSLPAD